VLLLIEVAAAEVLSPLLRLQFLVVLEAEELLVQVIPVMLLLELQILVVVAVVLDNKLVLIQTLRLVVQE
tara:strand:- start:47 stop:256 length:210 start_codon:yes stop_codon:yes gene_type:complete